MSSKGKAGKQEAVIKLPDDCRIAAAPVLLQQLRIALDAPRSTLDGSAVERVDTTALQLLLAFRRDAHARGHEVSWTGASDVLRQAAHLLGLAQTLAVPASSPAGN